MPEATAKTRNMVAKEVAIMGYRAFTRVMRANAGAASMTAGSRTPPILSECLHYLMKRPVSLFHLPLVETEPL